MPTPPVYSSTACNGFTRTRRSSKSGIPSRRIKISLLLARRKAAQKAAAGLPKFVHVVCVNFAWLKGDTNNQGQESKRTNRCTSTPQETPQKTWVQQGPSYTKYDTCTGFDRNETASAEKKQEHGQPVFARADNCGQLVAVPHKTKAMKPKTTKEATTFHAPLKKKEKSPANKRAAKHKRAASLHGKNVVKGTVTPCLGRALRRPLREVQHPACTAGCPPATGTAGSSTSGNDAHPACLPGAFAVDGVGSGRCVLLPVGLDAPFLAWSLLAPADRSLDFRRRAVLGVGCQVAKQGRNYAVVGVVRRSTVLGERVPLVNQFERPVRRVSG